MPARGCSTVTVEVFPREQHDKVERVAEREVSELPCGELGLEQLAALDRALEAAVWCPLRCHSVTRRWGSTLRV